MAQNTTAIQRGAGLAQLKMRQTADRTVYVSKPNRAMRRSKHAIAAAAAQVVPNAPAMSVNPLEYLAIRPDEPIDPAERAMQHLHCLQALAALESGLQPGFDDVLQLAFVVNMMTTFIKMRLCADPQNLNTDAVAAIERMMARHNRTGAYRLDGPAIVTLRAMLEDYGDIMDALPARTVGEARTIMFELYDKALRGDR